MPEWPEYINRAFEMFYYSGVEEEIEEAIETFASRWGGLDLETFTHVLDVGQGQDKLVAVFALGYSGNLEARAALLPFLHSRVRMERWASALCLGEMQEEQALPVLQDMLQEGLFEQEDSEDTGTREGVMWYEAHRRRVASLLGEWGTPTLVPALRQALQACWRREQQVMAPAPLYPWAQYLAYYHDFQDSLAFALGRLGAFGVLFQLELPPSHLNMALIYLVLGYLYSSKGHRYHNLLGQMMIDEPLKQGMIQVLEERFGFLAAEGAGAIERFFDDYVTRKDEER